jgi:hypothetical protein
MDGHSSYINVDFIKYCWNHKIIPICLPLYLIYLLQPLNFVIFLLLKHVYSTKVNEYVVCGITGINKGYFIKILGEIWL